MEAWEGSSVPLAEVVSSFREAIRVRKVFDYHITSGVLLGVVASFILTYCMCACSSEDNLWVFSASTTWGLGIELR